MRRILSLIILILSIPLLAMVNLAIGSEPIPLGDVFSILFSSSSQFGNEAVWASIIMKIRLPQTLTAMACGAGLSVAGLQMQTIFHNPLAGPSVLGVSSAASLGVALVVLLGSTFGTHIISQFGIAGNTILTIAAIVGAMLAMFLIIFLSTKVEGNVTLLIVGDRKSVV